MNGFNLITKLSMFLTLTSLALAASITQAQIISPSGQEVNFKYQAHFTIPVSADEQTDQERAQLHASHLFGLFHTPKMIAQYHIPGGMAGGIGSPRAHTNIQILSSEVIGDKVAITYSNAGKMLFHNNAAEVLLEKGYLDIPMPSDPYAIYDKKCTDEHYTSFGDYWYFYDIYREGCTYLSKPPMSEIVRIALSSTTKKKMDLTPKLPMLRGDNKNGSLFLIYAIHGFESGPQKDDSGRVNYEEFNHYLSANGFTEARMKPHSMNPMNIYTKKLILKDGKKINVEVRHLLATTSISSGSVVFAQFFKEAIETADVILYGGHSGLGGNLDLELLQDKAGKFKFNPQKKQLFFFDSCSSYSYYLENFAAEKTKAKIDIISYALSSYFHTSNSVWSALMDRLLDPDTKDPLWKDVLFDMESVLGGDTYLLNVGGI
ncbi:MAG: hypothetical protein H7328_07465 [Bdellovibrio sp.]|nr:hypothetical protein [Bdellovibrio sp.]